MRRGRITIDEGNAEDIKRNYLASTSELISNYRRNVSSSLGLETDEVLEPLQDHISNRSEHFSTRYNNIGLVRGCSLAESHRSLMCTKSTEGR